MILEPVKYLNLGIAAIEEGDTLSALYQAREAITIGGSGNPVKVVYDRIYNLGISTKSVAWAEDKRIK